MIESLLRWLARVLAGILERFADPELDAKLKAFNEKVRAADELAKEAERQAQESEAAYRENVAKRAEWDRLARESEQQAIESQARFVASQTKAREIEAELAKTQEFINRQSDRDSVRADV